MFVGFWNCHTVQGATIFCMIFKFGSMCHKKRYRDVTKVKLFLREYKRMLASASSPRERT